MQESVNVRMDKRTHQIWGLLAKVEQRTKMDEFRFLVKQRAKELKIKEVSL
jgi:hypothetical protein